MLFENSGFLTRHSNRPPPLTESTTCVSYRRLKVPSESGWRMEGGGQTAVFDASWMRTGCIFCSKQKVTGFPSMWSECCSSPAVWCNRLLWWFFDIPFVRWGSSVFYLRPWCKIVPCLYGLTTLGAGGSPVFYLSAITEGRWNWLKRNY